MDPVFRRAALIATAVTLPLIIIVALALGSLTGDSDPEPSPSDNPQQAITAADPPRASVDAAACAKVLAQLPVTLGPLEQRIVRTPKTPFVVAWGSPAVILRCGEKRPSTLTVGSSENPIAAGPTGSPYYFVTREGDANVWTTIDRVAYISVTIPSKYQGADIMPPISTAIGKALPAVCSTEQTAPIDELCTRRK